MKITNISSNTFKSFNSQREEIEAKLNDRKKTEKRNKAVLAASVAGALIPLALYNAKRGKAAEIRDVFEKEGSKLKDKVLASTKIFEVEDIKQIGVSVTGSIGAGLLAGTIGEKNKDNKKAKYKEGLYGFLNCMIPMGIITGAEALVSKKGIKTGILGKAGIVAGGIAGGMLLSNKIANGINKAVFKEEDDKFEKREMKPSDCLVHLDDVLGVMVISKVPFAKQAGKVLPLIYSHVGYETGSKESHGKH
ncbi:MAG: hypothetical protein Q4F80_02340 [bacterium]|nr:hypothetical protein [bacterium]